VPQGNSAQSTPHDIQILEAAAPRARFRYGPVASAAPFFFLPLFSGWVSRQQQAVIEYLREENRGLPAAQQSPRLRPTDDQRRRLAVKCKVVSLRRLASLAGIVTDTILCWYRRRSTRSVRCRRLSL